MFNAEGHYTQPETRLLFKHMHLETRTQKRAVHIVRRARMVSGELEIPELVIGDIRYSRKDYGYIYYLRKDIEVDLTTIEYAEIQAELERCKELMRVGKYGLKLNSEVIAGEYVG